MEGEESESEIPDMEAVLKGFGVDPTKFDAGEHNAEKNEGALVYEDNELECIVPKVRRSERLKAREKK